MGNPPISSVLSKLHIIGFRLDIIELSSFPIDATCPYGHTHFSSYEKVQKWMDE